MPRKERVWICGLPCVCFRNIDIDIDAQDCEVARRTDVATQKKGATTQDVRSNALYSKSTQAQNTAARNNKKADKKLNKASTHDQDVDSHDNAELIPSNRGSEVRTSTWTAPLSENFNTSGAMETSLDHNDSYLPTAASSGNSPIADISEHWDRLLQTNQATEPQPESAATQRAASRSHGNLACDNQAAHTQDSKESRDAHGGSQPANKQRNLEPLEDAMSVLQEMASLLEINDQQHVLAALVLLQRGVKHHSELLLACLRELVDIVVACLQSPDDSIVAAALAAARDMVAVFKDNLLQFMHSVEENQSLVMQLLRCATAKGRAKSIKTAADGTLRYASARLHQPTMVRILEELSAHHNVHLKAKAKAYLLVATYRLS